MIKIIKKSPAKIFFKDYSSDGYLTLDCEALRFKGAIKGRGIEEIVIPLRGIAEVYTDAFDRYGGVSALMVRAGKGEDGVQDYVFIPRLFPWLSFPVTSASWFKILGKILGRK